FLPCLGVSESEKARINMSAVTEKIGSETRDAISALQEEVSQPETALQDRMALDMLLASKGGVCTGLNASCCIYVDQSGCIYTDLN
ncbi:ERVV2 protein, partial [Pterocles burchelli]|nr:ERVV2 protein [Pterocles burchelli]